MDPIEAAKQKEKLRVDALTKTTSTQDTTDVLEEQPEVKGLLFPLYLNKEVIIRRRQKMAALPGLDPDDSREKIGSSLKGQGPNRGLTQEEERRFLPALIGADSKSSDFAMKTTEYWDSISKEVPPTGPNNLGGLKLEVGLFYEDSENMTAKEKYLKDLNAFKNENGDIINPAGEPINLSDYILYRYCKVYNEVANDISLVGMSPKIRFYMFTKDKEIADRKILLNQKKKAFALYQQNIGDRQWVDNMLRLFLAKDQDSSNPISRVLVKDLPAISEDEKDILLDDYLQKEPDMFINVGGDKNLHMKGFIELGIAMNILERIPNTTTILLDGTQLGHSMDEVVSFLSNPKNSEQLRTLKARINVTS